MSRRHFLTAIATLGTLTATPRHLSATQTPADDTPESLYARAYSIDAQCFAAAPPRTYVQYLTDEKIAALRTSGITALAMNMTANFAELSLESSLFEAGADPDRDVGPVRGRSQRCFSQDRRSG